ncbi:MAG: hypothetical protein P4K83_02065 [Terracidiphilus sp.]|nr:hypothetical protein [Terracidiphilus sp.]
MSNAATTQASSASETTGTPIPLSYGYVWATGKRHAYYTLQNTGYSGLDYTRAGIWLLGHGEWDGLVELWINDKLASRGFGTVKNVWQGWNWDTALDYPNQGIVWGWHSGCDAVIGSGLTPQSSGPDQECDKLWSVFPSAIQPLCFNRIAYYTIMRKQPVLWQTSNSQSDPAQWTDINPVGLWRALRVRLFDAAGNVTGYAWTRNPIWHWVDAWLRCELFPDYNLTYNVGPDALPNAVSQRFDWQKIYASAQYCDEALPNGQPRFSGDYSITQPTSMQAIESQILQCCRGRRSESQGMIAAVCDMPRASVFTFSREHILPGSFEASDEVLNTAGNKLIGKFRDLLVPACNTIASITNADNGDPIVTTTEPHPLQQADWIAMGGTNSIYDSEWEVSSVPDVQNPGTPQEVDPITFTIARKGNNYPASVGAGGAIGLLYSRFKERTPEFWHKNNMLARGATGVGIARRRKKISQTIDFNTSTYDQVSRVTRYERDRTLGIDQAPYVAPARVRFKSSFFARDAFGNLLLAVEPGDHVTLDSTLRYPYAGEYEVLDGLKKTPPACELEGSGGSNIRAVSSESGEIEIALQTYNPDVMYDTSDTDAAGWPSVPGSYPGNDTSFSVVKLANGGNFVFFSGLEASGSQVQLPSIGYPSSNFLAWASPAGNKISYHSATIVELCQVSSTKQLVLVYRDEGNNDKYGSWGGVVGYGALTWLSTDQTTTDANGMTWLPLTLVGGEEILFGFGVLANGATVKLPPGWSTSQMFARAYIHDMPWTTVGFYFWIAGAYIDANNVVHVDASDNVGHIWHGNASVLVFAWKNNKGTVTSETLGSATWLTFPLSDGSTFGVGKSSEMADGATFPLPSAAGDGSTLEAVVGSHKGIYTSDVNGSLAPGIGSCYLDQNHVVHMTFNNSSKVWKGTADIFATYSISGIAAATIVTVTPASATIAQGVTVSFSAVVGGNANQSVSWSVDGIAGGNATVGTIDANGNYTAPFTAGSHTITATSVATSTASGKVVVTVTGTVSYGTVWQVNGV